MCDMVTPTKLEMLRASRWSALHPWWGRDNALLRSPVKWRCLRQTLSHDTKQAVLHPWRMSQGLLARTGQRLRLVGVSKRTCATDTRLRMRSGSALQRLGGWPNLWLPGYGRLSTARRMWRAAHILDPTQTLEQHGQRARECQSLPREGQGHPNKA